MLKLGRERGTQVSEESRGEWDRPLLYCVCVWVCATVLVININ